MTGHAWAEWFGIVAFFGGTYLISWVPDLWIKWKEYRRANQGKGPEVHRP